MLAKEKRVIEVVAAAIVDGEGRVFIARRGPAEVGAGRWEFPGGKIEEDETPTQALHREIKEELGIQILNPLDLGLAVHEYDEAIVKLRLFYAELGEGTLTLVDHDQGEWLMPEEFPLERLLEADHHFLERIKTMQKLKSWGWSEFFHRQLNQPDEILHLARMASLDISSCEVWSSRGTLLAQMSGNVRRQDAHQGRPTAGDWVLLRNFDHPPVIEKVYQRKSDVVRMAPRGGEQVLAANVDFLFIVVTVNLDFSLRRMDRYLAMAFSRKITPVIVLNKIDLIKAADLAQVGRAIQRRYPHISCVKASAVSEGGADELSSHLLPGSTGMVIGSSGVGKSSLINLLLEKQQQRVQEIREQDSKGRHTTVARALFQLPGGGLIIDSPGLREVQLVPDGGDGVEELFPDIAEATRKCKFGNCSHQSEPGCMIQAFLASGQIDRDRWESFCALWEETK